MTRPSGAAPAAGPTSAGRAGGRERAWRWPWAPLLHRFLLRDPGEIARRARTFRIDGASSRQMLARLGDAFLGGYNAMLSESSLTAVAARGRSVAAHFRPFFFEGAAMGYLPRGYLGPGFTLRTAETDLLGMDPAYRYLYYVGLGFWLGMRRSGRPASLGALADHADPLYLPLCYDGFGFKTAFFDFPRRPGAWAVLDRGPAEHAPALHQGFGRALYFVTMDDEAGFRALRDRLGPERRADFEMGRALALAFTGSDDPLRVAAYLAEARSDEERAARLTGVTWALAAREMTDPEYLASCLATATPATGALLGRLPVLCREALASSRSYLEWQTKTRSSAVTLWTVEGERVVSEAASLR